MRPETMGTLVEAARGCHDAAVHYGTPFISGKDSLNNEYLGTDGQRHSIPPTLLISALGLIEDVHQAVSMDLKEAGNFIYLVGDFQPVFGGSHFSLVTKQKINRDIPSPSKIAPAVYQVFHKASLAGLVRSAHDLSEGGIAVSAAEMCIGGRLGIRLEISTDPQHVTCFLFGETNGCLLVEVSPAHASDFENLFVNLPIRRMGATSHDLVLGIFRNDEIQLSLPVKDLVTTWNFAL